MVFVGQHPDDLELVGGSTEGEAGGPHPVQLDAELVAIVDVVPVESDGLVQVSEDLRDVDGVEVRWGRRRVVGVRVAEEVPLVVELLGQVPEVGEADPEGVGEEDGAFEAVVGQEPVMELGPPILEGQLAGDLVKDLEARREAGLEGVVGQEPAGEAVKSGQCRQVDVGEGEVGQPATLLVDVVAGHLLEFAAEPVAEFGGGLLGEGDGDDFLDGNLFVDHQ